MGHAAGSGQPGVVLEPLPAVAQPLSPRQPLGLERKREGNPLTNIAGPHSFNCILHSMFILLFPT